MSRVLLVIMDGAGYDAALSECGWLEGAVALRQARRWKMRTALPSLFGANVRNHSHWPLAASAWDRLQ